MLSVPKLSIRTFCHAPHASSVLCAEHKQALPYAAQLHAGMRTYMQFCVLLSLTNLSITHSVLEQVIKISAGRETEPNINSKHAPHILTQVPVMTSGAAREQQKAIYRIDRSVKLCLSLKCKFSYVPREHARAAMNEPEMQLLTCS